MNEDNDYFYYQQKGYFGISASITERQFPALNGPTSFTYTGGSSDFGHLLDGDPHQWCPSITRNVIPNEFYGTSKTWCLKPAGTFESDASAHTYIDHIKYDETSNFFFGTMRSADTANPGNSLFLWQVKGSTLYNALDPWYFNLKRLSIGSEVYTTGVADY